MTTDAMQARLADLDRTLQTQVAQRERLRTSLRETQTAIARLEGACLLLRELLQAPVTPAAGNGVVPEEEAVVEPA